VRVELDARVLVAPTQLLLEVGDVRIVSEVDVLARATLRMTQVVFGYIDRVSEQVVAAYEVEAGL
jgi:hypothetical protein